MGFISDIFLGGAESDAADTLANRSRQNAMLFEGLRDENTARLKPYETAGANALYGYKSNIGADTGENIPTFTAPEQTALPQFSYESAIPQFSYTGEIPEFTRPTEAALPQFQAPNAFSFDPTQITSNPAYQFRLEQGTDLINRQASKGFRNSGDRMIDLMDYGQGLASTEYDAEYQRQKNLYDTTFNQGVTAYGLDTDRANTLYGRGLTEYDIDRARESDQYGRALTANELERAREQELYGRALTGHGLDTDRANTLYNRGLTEYDIARDVEREQYGRGRDAQTDRLNLIDVGRGATATGIQSDTNMLSAITNAQNKAAEAEAAGRIGEAESYRNLISDLVEGYSTYTGELPFQDTVQDIFGVGKSAAEGAAAGAAGAAAGGAGAGAAAGGAGAGAAAGGAGAGAAAAGSAASGVSSGGGSIGLGGALVGAVGIYAGAQILKKLLGKKNTTYEEKVQIAKSMPLEQLSKAVPGAIAANKPLQRLLGAEMGGRQNVNLMNREEMKSKNVLIMEAFPTWDEQTQREFFLSAISGRNIEQAARFIEENIPDWDKAELVATKKTPMAGGRITTTDKISYWEYKNWPDVVKNHPGNREVKAYFESNGVV